MWIQRPLVAGSIGALVLILTIGLRASSAGAQGGAKTVWDGVYNSEQANRGQGTYDKSCAQCHQDDLSGGGDEGAAVLRGADFFARWNDKTVAELFSRIEAAMPKNSPGSLSPNAYMDVISFLLKKNQVPAGDTELTPEPAKLGQIVITDKPR